MNKYLTRKKQGWMLPVIGMVMILAVACGAGTPSDQSIDHVPGTSAPVASAADETSTGSGLDEVCVQRVLGRSVTGFADITAAERDLVFQQCSGNEQEQRQRQLGAVAGTNVLDRIDQACATRVTGQNELDLAGLNLEQRQELFEECPPDGLEGLRGGVGGRPLGVNDELQECLADALGSADPDLFNLDQEQRGALTTGCGDLLPERFGDGTQGGGFPGFGEAQGGPGGFSGGRPEDRGGAGFFGLDLTSDCIRNVLGREATGPGDITREEFQRLFADCSQATP